jgi:hypothetical protein
MPQKASPLHIACPSQIRLVLLALKREKEALVGACKEDGDSSKFNRIKLEAFRLFIRHGCFGMVSRRQNLVIIHFASKQLQFTNYLGPWGSEKSTKLLRS